MIRVIRVVAVLVFFQSASAEQFSWIVQHQRTCEKVKKEGSELDYVLLVASPRVLRSMRTEVEIYQKEEDPSKVSKKGFLRNKEYIVSNLEVLLCADILKAKVGFPSEDLKWLISSTLSKKELESALVDFRKNSITKDRENFLVGVRYQDILERIEKFEW